MQNKLVQDYLFSFKCNNFLMAFAISFNSVGMYSNIQQENKYSKVCVCMSGLEFKCIALNGSWKTKEGNFYCY